MQPVKKFMHPMHMVNYYNAMLKRILMEYNPHKVVKKRPPYLFKEVSYYFTFVTQARNEFDSMLYALCCFAYDGEIIFQVHGAFDCSLWKFRRLGMAKTADKIERTIRVQFKRNNVPLDPINPFQMVESGLYWANIDWFSYKQLLKS